MSLPEEPSEKPNKSGVGVTFMIFGGLVVLAIGIIICIKGYNYAQEGFGEFVLSLFIFFFGFVFKVAEFL